MRCKNMAQTVDNFGILINNANVYNAVDYRDYANTEFVFDDNYMSGVAISCVGGGLTMFDTGVIPAGTLSGDYDLGIYYDCPSFTNQGERLMRYEIYEDGVLLPEDTTVYSDGVVYSYDLNTVTDSLVYGYHKFITLKSACTYQIKIKTSTSISTKVAILDYIYFARNGENATNYGKAQAQIIGARDQSNTETLSDDGTKLVFEVINGGLGSGSWAVDEEYLWGYTFNTPFKSIVGAFPVGQANTMGRMTFSWANIDLPNSQVDIWIRCYKAISNTSEKYVKILVLGFV